MKTLFEKKWMFVGVSDNGIVFRSTQFPEDHVITDVVRYLIETSRGVAPIIFQLKDSGLVYWSKVLSEAELDMELSQRKFFGCENMQPVLGGLLTEEVVGREDRGIDVKMG